MVQTANSISFSTLWKEYRDEKKEDVSLLVDEVRTSSRGRKVLVLGTCQRETAIAVNTQIAPELSEGGNNDAPVAAVRVPPNSVSKWRDHREASILVPSTERKDFKGIRVP